MSGVTTPSPGVPAPSLVCEGVGIGAREGPRGPRLDGVEARLTGPGWISIIGPNGAGKSTFLRALAGLLPIRGQVVLDGQPLGRWPARERARRLAWLGQSGGEGGEGGEALEGLDRWTAYDVAMLGRLPWRPWLGAPGAADRRAVRAALEAMDVWPLRDRPLGALSGGERQRVLLARAFAVEAGVLLLDEPLISLDPPHQADCLAAVRHAVGAGRMVITVLHELSLALLADRVLVLDGGRLVHDGDPLGEGARAAISQVFGGRVEVSIGPDGLPFVRLRTGPIPRPSDPVS